METIGGAIVAAVKGSGLDAELRRKLRGVPDHVHLKLVAKLLGKFESSPLVNGTDLVIEEALICSDEHADVVTNLTCDGLDRERRLSDCLRLDPSSSENEISHAMETVQHVACDRSGSVELAVSMVLCSNRLQCLRDAALRRQYDGARDAAERELIAALNQNGWALTRRCRNWCSFTCTSTCMLADSVARKDAESACLCCQ